MLYRRLYTNGATYFFTLITFNRQKIFSNINHVKLLKESILKIKHKYPFSIDAIVILPEHLHCIFTLPEYDHDFSLRIRLFKTDFSKKCNIKYLRTSLDIKSRNSKKEAIIWQRRFWEHQIRDEKDFNLHMDYIHYNAVKHGLTKSPKDWCYSSFLNCVKQGLYNVNWGAEISEKYFEKIINAE